MKQRWFKSGTTFGLLFALPFAVAAQYPERTITVEVGFPPGTGPDIVARTLGQQMGRELGEAVIVQNKAGAGGQIAAQSVANAKPDGYTLLLGEVGSMAIAPAAYKQLNYDVTTDFAPITEAVRVNMVLAVPADSPYNSLEEFLEGARSSELPVNFGTFGAATPGHFGAELFASEADFEIESVHYRNTSDAITGLVSGDVAAAFITTAMAGPYVSDNRLKALAVTGTERFPMFPDVPTFIEADMLDVDFGAWFAYFAPAGTPDDVLDILQEKIALALEADAVIEPLAKAGFVMIGSSRDEMAALQDSDLARWKQVVEDTGFEM